MNKTYEEILEKMKSVYFEKCGNRLGSDSLALKRLEIMASELFALSCYGDFILKQAFVQTAAGNYLDRHGAIRSCARKKASCASGYLTFSIAEPSEQNIVIPKNTVCSVKNCAYLQFATSEQGIIEIGETEVTVPAAALSVGDEYNVPPKAVSVMVNAPTGISTVRNDNAFCGGSYDEGDSFYRERIMKNYTVLPNGMNARSIENTVLLLEFVTDCFIPDAEKSGEIVVIVATKKNYLTEDQRNDIRDSIGIADVTGAEVKIKVARPLYFSVTVEADVRCGFDKNDIKEKVESIIKEACSSVRIGRSMQLNTISKKLISIDGISSFNIYSNDAYGETIQCESDKYLYLENLVVNCFDE